MINSQCEFCHKDVTRNEIGSYQRVMGWVQKRKQGGSNSVTLPSKPLGVAHGACIDQQKREGSVSWNQGTMFP